MPAVQLLATAEVPADLLTEIRQLLVAAFEGDFSEDDWQHTLGGWHVVVADSGTVVSHAAVVPRDLHVGDRPVRTGYVEGLATATARQRQGLGSLAMAAVGELLRGRFEMGALSTGRHHFDERLGWERWLGPTFVRHGSQAIRTEEEDDGIMVLRHGPGSGVDLRASLSCESRKGDDW